MPKVTVSVQTAGGQTIVLTEGDKLVREVTIECNSPRCAARHKKEKPSEVTLIDGQPMPPEGHQWLSLILPEASPQYEPMPKNFCGPRCVSDFLTYSYIAPPVIQKTDISKELPGYKDDPALIAGQSEYFENYHKSPAMADVDSSVGAHDLPAAVPQADGVGE